MYIDKDGKVFALTNGLKLSFSSLSLSDMEKKKIKSALFARILHVAVHIGMDYDCILECVKSLSMKFVRILRDNKQCLGRLNEPKF